MGSPPHRPGPLVVGLLLVLAGCGGALPGTDGPRERTVTPALVPTDRPTARPVSPGLSTGGVTDAAALERAHAEALGDTTFEERARTTVRFGNGSLAVEETYVSRHGTNATRIPFRRNDTVEHGAPDRSLVEADVWGNASFGARRLVTANGDTELGVFDGPGQFYRRPRGGYGLALRDAETDLRVRRSRSGSTDHVLTAEGIDADGPRYLRGTSLPVRAEGHARVRLDPDGAIPRFAVGFPVRVAGENATLRHVYTVERGNVTVARPPWFEEAAGERGAGPRSTAIRSSRTVVRSSVPPWPHVHRVPTGEPAIGSDRARTSYARPYQTPMSSAMSSRTIVSQ